MKKNKIVKSLSLKEINNHVGGLAKLSCSIVLHSSKKTSETNFPTMLRNEICLILKIHKPLSVEPDYVWRYETRDYYSKISNRTCFVECYIRGQTFVFEILTNHIKLIGNKYHLKHHLDEQNQA